MASSSADPTRLFGIPGAERLHLSLQDCYESDIDPWHDEPDHQPKMIEEWTVAPKRAHLPDASCVVDDIVERCADGYELDEYAVDEIENIGKRDDVKAAADALLDLIASKITYRMAEKLVAEHKVTWTEEGDPLIDGEPLYVKAPS